MNTKKVAFSGIGIINGKIQKFEVWIEINGVLVKHKIKPLYDYNKSFSGEDDLERYCTPFQIAATGKNTIVPWRFKKIYGTLDYFGDGSLLIQVSWIEEENEDYIKITIIQK